MEDRSNNIVINGAGSVSGGEVKDVIINGSGKITSDIKCKFMEVNGAGKCEGKVEAQRFSANGAFSCNELTGENMSINGSTKVLGNVNFKNIEINGALKTSANVNANNLKVNGKLTANEISADKTDIDGVIIAQSLFGDEVIMGDKKSKFVFSIISLFKKDVAVSKVDLIECTKIKANNLEAKIVRATDVEIGDNCTIELIEYSGTAKISPYAKVNKSVKI